MSAHGGLIKNMKKWSNWENVTLRTDAYGRDYLLQVRKRDDGKIQFANRSLDATIFHYILFHGQQGFDEIRKILNILNIKYYL